MSSCSRTRPERRAQRAAALAFALLTVSWTGSAAAAPVALPVAAVLVHGDRTTLVVDLGASSGPSPRATVTRDGVPQQATVVPVMSDGLAVALILDTSVAGAATLPAWQSAAARFVLEAPPTTRAAVIADSAPAEVIAGPRRGPADTVRALTAVPARGVRDTATALTLAMRQFPATPPGRRVVVLYTTGTDAAGEDAGALAARLRQSGTILVVVGPARAGPYWAPAASATGGFFAPAGDPVLVPALDQVSTGLTSRHLIEVPTPPTLPARMSVRVDTGDLILTGEALALAPPAPSPAKGSPPARTAVWSGAAVAALAVVLAAIVLLRRRGAGPPVAEPVPLVARGRATVRPPVARGRAPVPGTASDDRPPRE